MRAFRVYDRDACWIDTVFFSWSMTEEEVKKSLVDHDGYPVDIEVEAV